MKYVYEPLDKVPGAIRVLALQPAPHLDAPIQGSLEPVTHRTFPYIAISYVWGNPTITNWISLAGYEHGVGSNVFNVLRSVRSKSRTLFLWIDAICINQENIQERNTQVQNMANIYRNASEVIGWLGNKTLDFDAGFCLLKILIAGSSHQYLEDKAYETSWDALVRLLDRPYWTRVWILQETAINLRVSLRFADDQESEITVKNLSE